MKIYRLNIFQAIKIHSSNKDFMLFDINKDNKVVNIVFTNDLKRYRTKRDTFKLIENIKQQTNLLNIY